MEPDAWKTVLDKIKDSQDRRTASELMRVLFESLVDTEFDVLGRPATLRGGAENQFGYSVTENEKERCYDITVTNCERLSMRKMVKNLSRHKHVREIEVCNYGPDRGAFRNMTVTLRMHSGAAPCKEPDTWDMPAGFEFNYTGVSGLMVPDQSRDDALEIVAAITAYCDAWVPEMLSAESLAQSGGQALAFRIDARPVERMTMSFYRYLEHALGNHKGTAILQNIVLVPFKFDGQHAMQIAVHSLERPRPEATDTDRAAPRDPLRFTSGRRPVLKRQKRGFFANVLARLSGAPVDEQE